ncbi:hypothetical protein Ga0074812_12578 [Parafrankia irregularis]|uniref:Uncharacterized protein n=1 Tax=Parafrankia irregularis TaxID=795642 RepID=A0A0S4QV38_9ACTN|nr:hypothetical protein Ga0074812_12578 [Parafrankia irregularis]
MTNPSPTTRALPLSPGDGTAPPVSKTIDHDTGVHRAIRAVRIA